MERIARWPGSFWQGIAGNGSGAESSRYLGRWLVLGTVIGLISGTGAIVFSRAIEFTTDLFLGRMVDFVPAAPLGEGAPIIGDIGRPVLLPLVTALGGLLSGLIVFKWAPEAEGHGTDSVIDAIHHKGARLRARVAPIKLLASAITIGSGGSAGREGPTAQISAGFTSVLAERLKLTPSDRRVAVTAGIGAGIGAIFKAPLGGAVMAAEILYIHDLEASVLIPSLIASIVAFSLYGSVEGWEPIFGQQTGIGFSDPTTLIYYAILGIICGLVGLLYSRSFYGITALFHKMRVPLWVKPAIGGFIVGLIGLKIHGALHTGYGWVQISMTDELKTLPLWIVLALPFAKILSTSLSIGSGGSGGVFGPGMVVGGMLGAAFWRLGEGSLPHMPDSPAPFVIIGMMALFGGIAHAPLAMMLMVAEMTGNLSLLAPAMVAVALSTALIGDSTIYRSQLPSRADSPFHRLQLSFPLLGSLMVRDAMRPVGEEPVAGLPEVGPSMPLPDALESLSDAGVSQAVVTDHGRVVGVISARDAIGTYRSWMAKGVRRGVWNRSSSRLIESPIAPHAPIVGQTLKDVQLPPDTLVLSIVRGGEAIFPRADTVLTESDHITFLVSPESEEALRALVSPGVPPKD